MEGSPRFPNESGTPSQPERKSRRRHRRSVRVPGIANVEAEKRSNEAVQPQPKKPERPPVMSLFAEKPEPTATVVKSGESHQNGAREQPEPAASRAAEKHKKDKAADAESPSERYVLQPNELSGGEVIIQLDGADPVAEHVIPLHPEEAAKYEQPAVKPTAKKRKTGPAATAEPVAAEAQPVSAAAETDIEPVVLESQAMPTAPETVPVQGQSQPEQQHAARMDNDTPEPVPGPQPAPPEAAAGPFAWQSPEIAAVYAEQIPPAVLEASDQTPPVPPIESGVYAMGNAPEPPQYISHMTPLNERFTRASTQPMYTQRELNRATQAATGRGLFTGALVGGLYEHFKHKRREKRTDKRHEQRVKELIKAREQYQFTSNEQHQRYDAASAQLQQTKNQLAVQTAATARAENQLQTASGHSEQMLYAAAAEQPQRYEPLPQPSRPEYGAGYMQPNTVRVPGGVNNAPSPDRFFQPLAVAAAYGAAEQFGKQGNNPERRFAAPPQSPESAAARNGQATQEAPADRRVETSAWHAIEVDNKTGKAVEDPSFQYGQEYHNEQAPESGATAQRNAAAGEVALVAAAMSQASGANSKQKTAGASGLSGGGAAGGLTSAAIPQDAAQGTTPVHRTQTETSAKPSHQQTVSSDDKPLWPWLLALGVVGICLLFLV